MSNLIHELDICDNLIRIKRDLRLISSLIIIDSFGRFSIARSSLLFFAGWFRGLVYVDGFFLRLNLKEDRYHIEIIKLRHKC